MTFIITAPRRVQYNLLLLQPVKQLSQKTAGWPVPTTPDLSLLPIQFSRQVDASLPRACAAMDLRRLELLTSTVRL